jgi:hypothetical protein
MAANNTNTQIKLGVYRDRYAPFDPAQSKTLYSPTIGKSFNINGIKEVSNVVEGSTTYGTFFYHETDGEPRHKVLVLEASGTILGLCNI